MRDARTGKAQPDGGNDRLPDGLALAKATAATILATLLLPALTIEALGGGVVRALFPAYALAIAAWLATRHRTHYPAYILALFACSPFLRRLADYSAGFSVFNPILLAPYIALLPALPALLRTLGERASLLRWPVAAIIACVAYAGLLSLYQGAVVPTAYESLRWLMPVALCCAIATRPHEAPSVHRHVIAALCAIVPILALYGIYQYARAPLWDVYWMWNVDNPTFGEPSPYKIRVFSLMNSPGSVGVFASYAMVMLSAESPFCLLMGASGLPLLALTVIRTAWLSLAAGLAAVALRADPARRMALLAGCAIAGVAAIALFTSHALPVEVNILVSDRLASFASLGTDTSTYDRLHVYDAFYSRLADNPWGEGFGANESTATKLQPHRDVTPIDSGVLETYLIFGVFAGTLYFVAFFSVFAAGWRAVGLFRGRRTGHFGAACAALVILPLGLNQVGESGVLLWTGLGILIGMAQSPMSHCGATPLKSRILTPAFARARGTPLKTS